MTELLKHDVCKILWKVSFAAMAFSCIVACRSSISDRLASSDDLFLIRNDLKNTRIALFYGDGMSEESIIAAGRAFQWMGGSVKIVDADSIINGCLNNYEILVWAGGESRPNHWSELGKVGKKRICDFVREGGGFLGICFGAGYACSSWNYWGLDWHAENKELYLNLFNGVVCSGQMEIADRGSHALMTGITLYDKTDIISDSISRQMSIVYYPDSPFFQFDTETTAFIIGTYDITDQPAMIAFEYGDGKVFLSGPHPEIETDSKRDGSTINSRLHDDGSEWPLLLEVAKWLLTE